MDAAASVMTTHTGDLEVNAAETASITATAAAAAAASTTGGIGAAFSAAGLSSTNTISSQIDAYIANSTDVEAAGAVQVSAGNTPTVSDTIVAAALAQGLYGLALGLSQAQDMETETVAAYIDGSSVQAIGGNIAVMANSNPSITTTNVAAAITFALGGAAAGADSNLTIDTTTQAYVNNATLTATGNDVLVQATSTSTAAPSATSAAGGIVGVGVLTSEATIDGMTEAYADGQTTASANAFNIDATANNTITSESTEVAVGLAGIGILSQSATDTPTVQAYLGAGSNVQSNQSIMVDAMSSDDVTAQAEGVQAGLAAIGLTSATATMTPTVRRVHRRRGQRHFHKRGRHGRGHGADHDRCPGQQHRHQRFGCNRRWPNPQGAERRGHRRGTGHQRHRQRRDGVGSRDRHGHGHRHQPCQRDCEHPVRRHPRERG